MARRRMAKKSSGMTSQQRWAAAHPEKVRMYHERWAKKHPEKVKEYHRRWYNKHHK